MEPELNPPMDGLERVMEVVKSAQRRFRTLLESVAESDVGLSKERYVRYLSMQYHLTKGVQRPFLTAAAHSDLGKRRELRKFLVNFANEEEFHFEIALRDIENLGELPLPIPFDVELWWAYFNSIVADRPFVRLGATCVLENISSGSSDLIQKMMGAASYLSSKSTLFIRIHQHEDLPHGDQIFEALREAELEERHFRDLEEGAIKGATMYLRMAGWAMHGVTL